MKRATAILHRVIGLTTFLLILSSVSALRAGSLLQVRMTDAATVQLTWTNPPPNSILESVDELSDCLLWQAVPATPVFSNGQFSVTLPVTGTSRLFHLYPVPAEDLPPVWCPLPAHIVIVAGPLQVSFQARSPNRKPLTYGAVTPLVNATLDGALGIFRLTPVTAQLGENLFTFFATDGTLSATQQLRVTVSPVPLFEQRNADGSVTLSWSSAVPGFELLQSDTLGPDAAWTPVLGTPLPAGQRFQITVPPSTTQHYYRLKLIPLPPDPISVASPLAPNTFNDLGSSTAFLYTGPNPIQIGVVPGTIAPTRAAVVRGRVMKRDQSALPGVRVTVLNHPEYGSSFTRPDGRFDLAVNGGLFTVEFQAPGYCSAQRRVEAPFQDFRTVPDVALVPLDPVATPVIFGSNAPPQMAAGSPQTDADGTRTTRVFLPPGTTASLVMPDGNTHPVSGLTLHLTEYTVGANGPAAMPAVLPPTSAYTFCAEFNAEEELTSGAELIQFNQPVFGYVENFLKVPVGMLVPSGYYDRDQAAWVPQENGLLIQIIGVTNGLAQVQLTGSNVIADATALAAASFTTAELQRLASTYSPGQSIWRVPLSHFSVWDWNWAASGNGPGGNGPNGNPSAGGGGPKPQSNPSDGTPNNYGNVNFTTQVFGESIPLVGVPVALHYSSARVPDYRANAQVVVQALAWPPPTNVLGLEVQFEVAGRSVDQQLGMVPTATFSWDGYDAYGRFVGGSHMASGRIILETPFDYSGFAMNTFESLVNSQPLFASYGQTAFAAGHSQTGFGVSVPFSRLLTVPDHRALGLGGWSLTPHHSYDPVGGLLYLGDGTVLRQDRLANGMNTVPGLSGVPHYTSALNAAAGQDGTLFLLANFDDSNYPRFCKINPQGQFTYLSGNPSDAGVVAVDFAGYGAVDGQPALLAAFSMVTDMTVGPDGSLYFRNKYTIGRIDPQGILHKVLGDGGPYPYSYPPDGTLASHAMTQPTVTGCLAVGPDGTVYYDDFWNAGCPPGAYTCGTNFIRKVAPDGRIYTVAGQRGNLANQSQWRTQMGQTASTALLTQIAALAAAPDGTLYVSPYWNFGLVGGIYRIARDGTLGMVMNAVPVTSVGYESIPGDDGTNAATFASYYGNLAGPNCLWASSDGSVTFAQAYAGFSSASVIWRITPDGFLQRLAGRFSGTAVSTPYPPSRIGANPLQVLFPESAVNLALGPDGSVTLVGNDHIPHRFGSAAAGFDGQELEIPAQDASEVYIFDAHGLHLRTLDGLTGWTNWSFAYNANNQITDLHDANGLVTHIERDGAGRPTAIVGPYGQRTTLGLDANGFLNAVTNPVGEATALTYSPGGLLTSITGPLTDTYTVAYDTNGLVTQIRDPRGGGYDMASANSGNSIAITSSTTLSTVVGRVLTLQTSGDTAIAAVNPDGTSNTTVLALSGASSTTYSDGTLVNDTTAGDSRFPQATQVAAGGSFRLPGGLTGTSTASRSAVQFDSSNPFSIASLSNSASVNGRTYTSTYDGTNRLFTLTSPAGRRLVIGLDGLGRTIHREAAGDGIMDILYDAQGRVAEIDNTSSVGIRRTTCSYDSLGRLSLITDPLGRTNQYTYDNAGRLVAATLPDGQVVTFQSDAESRVTALTPPGRPAHRFEYNAVGLVTNYIPPVVNGADESVHFGYDADRNLTQVQLPDGQNVLQSVGPGGRPRQVVLGSGPTLTYTYAPDSGRLTNVVSTSGDSLRLAYQGAFTTNVTWSGTITGRVSLSLNTDFLPASQSVNGTAITYAYDRDLLLTNAGSLSITRDAASGAISSTRLGNVSDQRQFDDRGLLTNYTARVSGTSIWTMAFAYDALDRMTNKTETINGVTRTFDYTYDLAGRLSQVSLNGVVAASYSYDANGNRLTRNGETAAYDAQDRVQSYADAAFGWSRNGALQTRTAGGQTTTYTYDVRGGLTAVSFGAGQPITYVNDAAERRIVKNVSGALERGWLWDGDLPIAELGTNSTVSLRFVYGADGAVPSFLTKGTNTFRLLSDERGSVRFVINVADGSIAQALDYDEFGRVLQDTAPAFQPFGFAGGLYDPDTGLVRFRVRDYSAETGQWTARDPIGFLGGDYGLFNYVNNDPINQTDPFGTGPYLASLRGAALAGDPRAARAYRNLLRADQLIAEGVRADALASAEAYGRATRVTQGAIATLGIVGGVSVFAQLGSAATLAAGAAGYGTVEGSAAVAMTAKAAAGTFLLANAGVQIAGNAGNLVNQAAGVSRNDVPTSIAQATLPPKIAAAADTVLGVASGKLPQAGPGWLQQAGSWSSQADNVSNAKTVFGGQ